jgi:hypothetical protein
VLNTSITQLSYDADGVATLQVFNDSLHLASFDLFPHPTEMSAALALVCADTPDPAFGAFAAHYDCQRGLGDLLSQPDAPSARFTDVLASVRLRHPSRRVALSASAARIQSWAGEALWPLSARAEEGRPQALPHGRLGAPPVGAVCHVSMGAGHAMLIDYGVVV